MNFKEFSNVIKETLFPDSLRIGDFYELVPHLKESFEDMTDEQKERLSKNLQSQTEKERIIFKALLNNSFVLSLEDILEFSENVPDAFVLRAERLKDADKETFVEAFNRGLFDVNAIFDITDNDKMVSDELGKEAEASECVDLLNSLYNIVPYSGEALYRVVHCYLYKREFKRLIENSIATSLVDEDCFKYLILFDIGLARKYF